MTAENRVRIVAIDAGATWSRGILLSVSPTPAGSHAVLDAAGQGGPGNPNHIGEAAATANISSLLLSLLAAARVRGTEVDAVGIGSTLASTGLAAARLCPSATAVCVPDTLAAFYSGSSSLAGVVATAGTGSMVSRVDDGALARSAGGWGWVLGDEGGAVSLGRQCVRAVMISWEGGPPTAMAAPLADIVGGSGAEDVYAYIYRGRLTPAALSSLAPLVTEAAAAGDEVASRVLDADAERLSGQISGLLGAGESPVLAGGLAQHLAGRVRTLLGVNPTVVRDGVVGAAMLASGAIGMSADRGALSRLWEPHAGAGWPS